jgi:hypothetical protein
MKRMLCVLLLVLPGVAAAQPRLVPTGDVTATYRLGGAAAEQLPGGARDGVRLDWDAANQRLRADPVNGPVFAVVDLSRRLASLVFAQQSSVIVLPLRAGDPQTLLAGPDVRFTRLGTARLLGMECTEWRVQSRKVSGTGCVTADGVVLRAEGSYDGRAGSVTAVSVTPGPVAPERFTIPANYFRLPFAGAR